MMRTHPRWTTTDASELNCDAESSSGHGLLNSSNLAASVNRPSVFPLGGCRRDLFPNFWTKIEEGRITVGKVELFIQERGAKTRRVVHDYPTDQIPKVADKVSFRGRNFRVMEIKG